MSAMRLRSFTVASRTLMFIFCEGIVDEDVDLDIVDMRFAGVSDRRERPNPEIYIHSRRTLCWGGGGS